MKKLMYTYIIAVVLAIIVESINMGIGQNNWVGMLYTSFLFYGLFSIIGYFYYTKINGSKLSHFLLFGLIGLIFEWVIFGMTPTNGGHIVVVILIQLGMFSHWASITVIPRLLLDDNYKRIKKRNLIIFYFFGMILVYLIGMFSNSNDRFTIMILGNLIVYILMLIFIFRYVLSKNSRMEF